MPKPLDFQSMIFTLQKFWADQGCLIWQPYYTQVGAGTNEPGHLPARARPGTLERGLCRALHPPG